MNKSIPVAAKYLNFATYQQPLLPFVLQASHQRLTEPPLPCVFMVFI